MEYREHVNQIVSYLRDRLNLTNYQLDVTISTRAAMNEAGQVNACVSTDTTNRRIEMCVAEDAENTKALFTTLFHEFLHVQIAPLANAAWDVANLLKGDARKLARKTLVNNEECCVVLMTAVLVEPFWEEYLHVHDFDEGRESEPAGTDEEEGERTLN